MTTFEEILAQAGGRPEDTVALCLRADLVGEHRRLERELATASTEALSLGEPAPAKAIAEQVKALEQQMHAASVTFKLRAMAPLEWSRFLRTRPEPQKDEPDDAWDERWHQWICALVAAVCYDPVMTAEQVEQLAPNLSHSQWAAVADAAMALNSRRESVPFSAAASALTATSGDE